MITVANAVTSIIKQSPVLQEGLSRGLLNTSAVARDIKHEVEKRTYKNVTDGAIIMALQRLSVTLVRQDYSQKVFKSAPDMVIRSNLFEYTVADSFTLGGKQQRLFALVNDHNSPHFLTLTSGVFETTVIASNNLRNNVQTILQGETVLGEIPDLASITIRLTQDIVNAPGAYAYILRLISWEGINVVEVVSTYMELTIVIKQEKVDQAFSVLKNAFR